MSIFICVHLRNLRTTFRRIGSTSTSLTRLYGFVAIAVALAVSGWAVNAAEPESTPATTSKVIEPGPLPLRVHVFEDYETEIEKRWWLRGKPETDNVPPSLSASVPNRRACRATETKDFDDKQGDAAQKYNAVIFNPVPGPPMGKHTRLAFRYWLKGTGTLRVQIYSLTNNYHRRLILTDLPQGSWQSAAVDMTAARRPDGSGGSLGVDERIDDIQFYVEPAAELIIDDIVLYEAAPRDERRPFPRRVIFTGWFDTGKQGEEWPGDFAIVPHEKPLTWDAAQAVPHPTSGEPWLRIGLRGDRTLGAQTLLRFRYKLTGENKLTVTLAHSETGATYAVKLPAIVTDAWTEAIAPIDLSKSDAKTPLTVNEIRFQAAAGAELLIDDLLLFEPGKTNGADSPSSSKAND